MTEARRNGARLAALALRLSALNAVLFAVRWGIAAGHGSVASLLDVPVVVMAALVVPVAVVGLIQARHLRAGALLLAVIQAIAATALSVYVVGAIMQG